MHTYLTALPLERRAGGHYMQKELEVLQLHDECPIYDVHKHRTCSPAQRPAAVRAAVGVHERTGAHGPLATSVQRMSAQMTTRTCSPALPPVVHRAAVGSQERADAHGPIRHAAHGVSDARVQAPEARKRGDGHRALHLCGLA